MDENLRRLAERLGIVTEYTDSGLNIQKHVVSDETVRFFAEELGYKASTPEDVEKSLRALDKRRWQYVLEPVYVVAGKNRVFEAVLPATDLDGDFSLTLTGLQTGEKTEVSFIVTELPESRLIGKKKYHKVSVEITSELAIGYYNVEFSTASGLWRTLLAVAPEKCYVPAGWEKKRLWGFCVQLYSLRSRRNWGIGDFTDLYNFADICRRAGADVIGLNPVNVLGHCFPEEASPYMSISRLFLNPIYIDVESVPEFEPEDRYQIEADIADLNAAEKIDYGRVYPLKIKVLQSLYKRMKEDPERMEEFAAFCREKGEDLDRLAAFQALYEDKWQDHWGGWRAWEKEFRSPNSAAVKKYCREHADRLGFFKFLQFEADRQLKKVAAHVREAGLQIGIYRDLPVGVGRDSAEAWSDEGVFLRKSGAGAPPDAFFPTGQKWNLAAFDPFELKARAYAPFIRIIRAAAAGAGALRLDHVMSLMRLFVIPEAAGKEGTYLLYNFEDMLNIVALESHLNRCLIVGESIGNVPEGFLDRIAAKNIMSMSVLWSERWDAGWGDFKAPYQYPENVVASVGTHDMPPLKMWWFGYDIALSRQLGITSSDEEMRNNYHKREADRWKLLKAMDENQVWPEDNHRRGDYLFGEGYPEGLEEAVHRFMARSNAKIFLVQPEDVFQVDKQQNVPGTDRDRYPNWRLKLPVNLEDMENMLAYYRNIAAVKKER